MTEEPKDRTAREWWTPLEKDSILIGRDPNCDLHLAKDSVSRRHAKIFRQDEQYFIGDLDSSNGSYLNGKRLLPDRSYRIRSEDVIQICQFQLYFKEQPEPGLSVVDTPADSGSKLKVVMVDGNEQMSSISEQLENSSSSWQLRTSSNAEAKLLAFMQITQDLHSTLRLDEVIDSTLKSLLKIFANAALAAVVLDYGGEPTPVVLRRNAQDDQPVFLSRSIINHVMESAVSIISDDLPNDERFSGSDSVSQAMVGSLMCAPLVNRTGSPLGILQMESHHAPNIFNANDLDLFSSVAALVSFAIENSRLHESAMLAVRLERELKLTRAIQASLLPQEQPKTEEYDFFDFYEPAREVGGDYFDYHALPDGRTGIVLADVAGKSMPAALLMASLSGELRVHLSRGLGPVDALKSVNASLMVRGIDDRFVTMVLAILDPIGHQIDIGNAGHMCPLLRNADRELSKLGEECVGLPLGVEPNYQYRSLQIDLEPGDTVTIYSDGITDAMNRDKAQFGLARLEETVVHGPLSPALLGASIIQAVRDYSDGDRQFDDISLICFGRTANSPPSTS